MSVRLAFVESSRMETADAFFDRVWHEAKRIHSEYNIMSVNIDAYAAFDPVVTGLRLGAEWQDPGRHERRDERIKAHVATWVAVIAYSTDRVGERNCRQQLRHRILRTRWSYGNFVREVEGTLNGLVEHQKQVLSVSFLTDNSTWDVGYMTFCMLLYCGA